MATKPARRITSLKEDWESFEQMLKTVGGVTSPIQISEMKKAFVAGYWVAFDKIAEKIPTHTDERAFEHLTRLKEELDELQEELFKRYQRGRYN